MMIAHCIFALYICIGLGEILAGNDLRNSGYSMQFAKDQPKTVVCTINLDTTTTAAFKQAVSTQSATYMSY
jgi:Endomembrane protein 70